LIPQGRRLFSCSLFFGSLSIFFSRHSCGSRNSRPPPVFPGISLFSLSDPAISFVAPRFMEFFCFQIRWASSLSQAIFPLTFKDYARCLLPLDPFSSPGFPDVSDNVGFPPPPLALPRQNFLLLLCDKYLPLFVVVGCISFCEQGSLRPLGVPFSSVIFCLTGRTFTPVPLCFSATSHSVFPCCLVSSFSLLPVFFFSYYRPAVGVENTFSPSS